MKQWIVASLLGLLTLPAQAALNVFACEPEWAALVTELGGEHVSVYAATTAQQDPHRIEARPSLIARMRQADMLVCTGAELEAGWLPVLLRQSGNGRVQPGQPGHFMAAEQVERLEIPVVVDRALGDLHMEGNPHVHTDPRRLLQIAAVLAERLTAVDGANAAHYGARFDAFRTRWEEAMERWSAQAAALRNVRIVSHHQDWVYLNDWLGLVEVARLEPKPGIPPSAAHLAALTTRLKAEPAVMVLRTPYQDARPGEWLAARAGMKVVVLPYTVGGSDRATDLFALFDETVVRLLEAVR
ncbi:MAG: zinc ABC transporter substrate-binding protein [Thiohalomonadaceae bacterium]